MVPIRELEVETLTSSETRRRLHPSMRLAAHLLLAAFFAASAGNVIRAQAPDSIRAADGQATFDPASGRAPRRLPVLSSSVGLCTDPLPGVAAPNAPHGLFALLDTQAAVVNKYILNQPEICGASMYVIWSAVDKGGGQYDWSSVDQEMAPWTAAGKKVNLIVWAVSDSVPNTATPAYVLDDPNYQFVTCQWKGSTTPDPVYYVDPFKSYYKTFIQAVLNRYGANPNIAYIRFGLSKGGEASPSCLNEMMSYSGFSNITQFDPQWESYVAEMTEFQKSVLAGIQTPSGQPMQLMAALNPFGVAVQYSVCDFEAKNAASLGFGFGSQGYSQADIASYQSGQPCMADWCAMFKQYVGQVPLELQTQQPGDPTNAAGGTGSMAVLLPFALSMRTQIFEVAIQDLEVAYDPASQYYAQYGKAYQQAYQQVAETVGYGSKP